jgi:hypothetical protein
MCLPQRRLNPQGLSPHGEMNRSSLVATSAAARQPNFILDSHFSKKNLRYAQAASKRHKKNADEAALFLSLQGISAQRFHA